MFPLIIKWTKSASHAPGLPLVRPSTPSPTTELRHNTALRTQHKDVHSIKAFLLLCKYQCTRYQDITCSHTHRLLQFIPFTNISLLAVTLFQEEQCQDIRKTMNGDVLRVASVKSTHFKDCDLWNVPSRPNVDRKPALTPGSAVVVFFFFYPNCFNAVFLNVLFYHTKFLDRLVSTFLKPLWHLWSHDPIRYTQVDVQ
jgi:hypothetical protein